MQLVNISKVLLLSVLCLWCSIAHAVSDEEYVYGKHEFYRFSTYTLMGPSRKPLHSAARYSFHEYKGFYKGYGKYKNPETPKAVKRIKKDFQLKEWINQFSSAHKKQSVINCIYPNPKKPRTFRSVLFMYDGDKRNKAIAPPIDELYAIHPYHPVLLIGAPLVDCPPTLAEAKAIVAQNFSGKPIAGVNYPSVAKAVAKEEKERQIKKEEQRRLQASDKALREIKAEKDYQAYLARQAAKEPKDKKVTPTIEQLDQIPIPASVVSAANASGIKLRADTKVGLRMDSRKRVQFAMEKLAGAFGELGGKQFQYFDWNEWRTFYRGAHNSSTKYLFEGGTYSLTTAADKVAFDSFVSLYSSKCSQYLGTNAADIKFDSVTTTKNGYNQVTREERTPIRMKARPLYAKTYYKMLEDAERQTTQQALGGILSLLQSGGRSQNDQLIEGKTMQAIFEKYDCNSSVIKQLDDNLSRALSGRQSAQAEAAAGELASVGFYNPSGTPYAHILYLSTPDGWVPPSSSAYESMVEKIYETKYKKYYPDYEPVIVRLEVLPSSNRENIYEFATGPLSKIDFFSANEFKLETRDLLGVFVLEGDPPMVYCRYMSGIANLYWYKVAPKGTSKKELLAKHPKNPYLKVLSPRDRCPSKGNEEFSI